MGVYLEPLDLEKLFESSPVPPIVVNDLACATVDERARLDGLLSVRYEADYLSNEPSCECGELRGGYLVGTVCQKCGTRVTEQFDHELIPIAWIRQPRMGRADGVEKLITPLMLTKLCQRFTRLNFDIIEWLINTDYSPGVNKPFETTELQLMGVVRGYNSFVVNFDRYMEILFNLKAFKQKGQKQDELYQEIKRFRSRIFTSYIPIINKSLTVIEGTSTGTYVDPIAIGAINAARMLTGIDTPLSSFSQRQCENRTAKALLTLAKFYNELDYNVLAKKTGMFRKHVFGSRISFTIRAVISSITDPHDYESVKLPWSASVTAFSLHLTNKLLKLVNAKTGRYFTVNEIFELLNYATYNYDALIDSLFKEMIAEANGGRGIRVVFQRNPSLQRGSAQGLYADEIKTNIDDPTISMSILDVVWPNADFDGDAMNLTICPDDETALPTIHLSPHKSMYSLNEHRKLADGAVIPKTVAMTHQNWLHHPEPAPTVQELSFLMSLPDSKLWKGDDSDGVRIVVS